MADKRATPEAPQQPPQETLKDAQREPPRGNRAAPTIDLTAAEVPPPGRAGALLRRGKARRVVDDGRWASPRSPARCVVLLVLFGLWRSGVLPIGDAGSSGLNAKVAALEKQVSELQSPPAGAR